MRLGLIGTGRIGTMHARTLLNVDGVTELRITDALPERASRLAEDLRAEGWAADAADTEDDLYSGGVDAVVITAATHAHAALIHGALDREVPVFCEKPVALDVPGTRGVVEHDEAVRTPLQIGFQRRYDAGYRAARDAIRSGRLGWLHTLRAVTGDQGPPPAEYIATSGGLFRDCSIHDFDVLRWITGREVVSVCARGANRGAAFFAEGDDVDTGAALLEFDDGLLATVTATRYNGAGHDVRLEVCGSQDAMFVGNDDRAPLPSAEEGVTWPSAEPYRTFLERFRSAYVAELTEFVEVAAGRSPNPCTAAEALEALYVAEACDLSRRTGRPVTIEEVRA
ncbi:Gfo/Idh/MocA family oxidoreductase [Saccharopolyspora sp. NFXS83]|uniref:Gfo/Idh/MocA family protein n=1 Tax=Saccharopolyspora sp. NFXS83 TaxID=2993560 RepID=UPI00224ABEBE|nr:Gfo/Idh/MocA family oxidoreductase [Saccharopolyspora sp. NFXS83]MCX2733063.1 Gfo/Idh/MocA family oxidoreductase [Saccharopolyspora sp. NFXS83]